MRSILEIKLSSHDQLDWVRSMTKTRQDNDVTNHIDQVQSMMKTILNNDVTDHTSVFYVKNNIELS